MTKVNHLNRLCIIHVDFDIWSGQTRLTAADLKLGVGGEIPPEKIALLGSKKICDPAKLKGFHRLKTETRRLLLKFGMPFMNGFAVPVEKVDEITGKLDDVGSQFNALKQDFIRGYNMAVDEWCQENPEYEGALRAGALPKETVEKRIAFEYQAFMIVADSDTDHAMKLNRKVECLGDDLITEVTQEANKFYMERLAGRDQCALTTRQTLRNIRDKVDGLSFLNSAFTPLVKLLDQTLRGYDQHAEGRNVVAPFFYQVVAAVLIMSDKGRIEQYSNGALTVEGMAVGMVCAELVVNTDQKPVHHVNAQPVAPVTPEIGNTNAQAAELQVDEDDIDAFFNNFAQSNEAGRQKEEPTNVAPVVPGVTEEPRDTSVDAGGQTGEQTNAAPVVPGMAEEPLKTPVANVVVNQTTVVELPPQDDGVNDLYF